MERIGRHPQLIYRVLLALIILSLLCIALFAIILPLAATLSRPTLLSINLAPGNAALSLNGKKYQSGVYSDVAPGDYTGTISADGFKDKEIQFTLSSYSTTTIYDYLEHTKEGLSYFERSNTDLQVLRHIDDASVQDFIKTYDQKLRIKSELPINELYDISLLVGSPRVMNYKFIFSDGSSDGQCEYVFCLRVSSFHSNQTVNYEAAKAILRSKSYNIEDYHVIFIKKDA